MLVDITLREVGVCGWPTFRSEDDKCWIEVVGFDVSIIHATFRNYYIQQAVSASDKIDVKRLMSFWPLLPFCLLTRILFLLSDECGNSTSIGPTIQKHSTSSAITHA